MSEQPSFSDVNKLVSLYVHIPFCIQRCHYCDFNTYANRQHLISAYLDALNNEIKYVGEQCREKIHTIYFGGGTPSVLPADAYQQLMNEIQANFKLVSRPEITMEVNPGTIQPGFLHKIQALGWNRLSIGMQSAVPEELRMLGRIHTPLDVIETVKSARMAGFENISLDLMFGLPGQTLSSWKKSLNFALTLAPAHISLYSLTIEKGTRFEQWWRKGLLPVEPDDLAADLYEFAISFLKDKKYSHYEISNWALADGDDKEKNTCKHNLQYWLNLHYIGVGAGAHSLYDGFRWENPYTIEEYIHAMDQMDGHSTAGIKKNLLHLDQRTQMQETMFMGLRLLKQGVSAPVFEERFGVFMQTVFSNEIRELLKLGLVDWRGRKKDHLCLTKRGCLMGNQVFIYFVD